MATEQQGGTDVAQQDAAQQQAPQGDAAQQSGATQQGSTDTAAKDTPPADGAGAAPQGDAAGADATKSDAAQTQAPSQDQAAAAVDTKQAAVTATVRKTIPAPAAQQQATRDASVQQAPTAAVPQKTVAAGVTVQKTDKSEVVDDRQLPEVLAAMKVAKPQTQSALYQVIQYADDMNPAKRNELKQIEQAQANLRVALYTLLSAEDTNFKVVYQALLAVVRAHSKKCFAITARNRGLNTVSLQVIDNKNMRFLTKIVDLLVLTAGTNDIEQVKQHYDFSKMAEWCPNVRIQQNLTSYYA